MRLELDILNIKDVQFAEKTKIGEKVLYINRAELQEFLQQDRRFSKVDIELAHPGEKCRIVRVSDVVEPRTKITEGYEYFPGALGKRGTAGDGRTCVLRGVAVVTNDQGGPYRSTDPVAPFIDMSGPAAELSIYAKTHNVVVIPYPADGVDPDDYAIALKLAGLKTATYLAQVGKDLKQDEVEVYDLPSLAEISKGMEGLPKVAHIYQANWTQFEAIPGEPILYGDSIRRLLPTIIHPNEVLDGAIVRPYFGWGIETYAIQNHPVVKELYRRHGKDLCFVGVVLTQSFNTAPERDRSADMAAGLAKSILGADGAILNKIGGGAPQADLGETGVACEEIGIKTVLFQSNFTPDGSIESDVLYNNPKLDAIVSAGAVEAELMKVPAVERVIGRLVAVPKTVPLGLIEEILVAPIDGELRGRISRMSGVSGQIGDSKLVGVPYQKETDIPAEKGFRVNFVKSSREPWPEVSLRNEVSDKTAAERAVSMLLAKLTGQPFKTEIVRPKFESVKPPAAVRDLSSARIALVTDSGLAPKGNPDKIKPGNNVTFWAYSFKGFDTLTSENWESNHSGGTLRHINQDPNRAVPVDVMRDLEKEGVIGKLHEIFYTTAGGQVTVENSRKMGQAIAEQLKAEGVAGVILTSL